MSLGFTDENIKNISKDILLIPFTINDPETGLIAQKNKVIVQKGELEKTDKDQKVFSDLWTNAVSAYHAEYIQLSANQKTNYADIEIDKAARKSESPHFPVPTWTKLVPMVIPSNNGNPVSTVQALTEQNKMFEIPPVIQMLKSGFNDGAGSWSGDVVGSSIESITVNISSLSVGNRIYVTSGSNTFAAEITEVDIATEAITFTVLFGTSSNGPTTFTRYFSGFTDNQRSGIDPIGTQIGVYNDLRSRIIEAVNNWKSSVSAELIALNQNPDLPPRKSRVTTARIRASDSVGVIDAWLALPDLAVGGITTNQELSSIENELLDSASFCNLRSNEIVSDLGSVSQTPDGLYTGSGVYLELFKTIDLRAASGTGSLSKFYDSDSGIVFFDKKIRSAEAQLAQYESAIQVNKLASDAGIGQDTFTVQDVTGLSITDEIKIMDNDSIVFTRSITQIAGLDVRLSSGIPVAITVGRLARICKLK